VSKRKPHLYAAVSWALKARIIDQLRSRKMKVATAPIATMGFAAMGAEKVIPIIEQMAWMVIEATPTAEFVISDNPVAVYSPGTPSYMGAGYLTPDVEVTMPLSRRHPFALVALRLVPGPLLRHGGGRRPLQ
jgi:hypothetical protein